MYFTVDSAMCLLLLLICCSSIQLSAISIGALTTAVAPASSELSLAWNVTATASKGRKQILQGAFGSARVGRIHAILGPSGCGKTTLLNALSGDVPGSVQLFGDISACNPFKPIYIQQQDLLFAQLTTAETLDTSYQLALSSRSGSSSGSSNSRKRGNGVIATLLNDLGLKKVANTKVGDDKTRGLSGGEKKRLSIGNEIIDSSSTGCFLFADEPTSGLDCFQAQKVVALLQQLAASGNTVLFSIHQPRSSIVALFDDVTLLSEGRVVYSGAVRTLLPYFQAQGFPCPAGSSPAEYYVDLVSVDFSSPQEEAASRKRIALLADRFSRSSYAQAHRRSISADGLLLHPATFTATTTAATASSSDGSTSSSDSTALTVSGATVAAVDQQQQPKVGFLGRFLRSLRVFRILNLRAWRQVTRDNALNIARLSSSLFSALLFGAIYFRLNTSSSSIPDRLGLLQVAAVNTAMSSLIKATTAFVAEKLVVQRERRRGAYGVLPYFLAKIAAEVPLSALFPSLAGAVMYKLCGLNPAPGKLRNFLLILVVESLASTALGMSIGSLVPTVESGVAIAPAVMVIFIVFGGLYVVNTPSYLSWVPKASLIRWAYEALCVNEFSGLEFESDGRIKPGPPAGVTIRGEDTLQRMGMGSATVASSLCAQAAIIAFNYAFTCLVLFAQRPAVPGRGYNGSIGSGGMITTTAASTATAVSLLHQPLPDADHSNAEQQQQQQQQQDVHIVGQQTGGSRKSSLAGRGFRSNGFINSGPLSPFWR